MSGVTDFWHWYQNETGSDANPIVVFSTESEEMVQNQTESVANVQLQRQFPFHFRFVRNTRDVTPDSGWVKRNAPSSTSMATTTNITTTTAPSSMPNPCIFRPISKLL
jgi:hypothetical protein